MQRNKLWLAGGLALSLALAGPVQAGDDDDEIPWDVASLYFELNDTDGDLGIHGLIDGEDWKKLTIELPNGRNIMSLQARRTLAKHGMTELFFESSEPDFEELDPEVFFRRFPEGLYEIEGLPIDSDDPEIESEVFVSHVIPARVPDLAVNGIPAAEGCDGDLPEVSEPVTISWGSGASHHAELGEPGPVTVAKYELVVEREEPESLALHVDLPPGTTAFELPADFVALDSGDGFKFEVLLRAESGNQTAVESCFELE